MVWEKGQYEWKRRYEELNLKRRKDNVRYGATQYRAEYREGYVKEETKWKR